MFVKQNPDRKKNLLTSQIYIIHSRSYSNERTTIMDSIRDINVDILNQNDKLLVRMLVFPYSKSSKFVNIEILNSLIEYILITKRFDVPPL